MSAPARALETTDQYIARTVPADLFDAYQRAATEEERERAAMALYWHYAAIRAPYEAWYQANRAATHWHGIAGRHRCNIVATRVPSPYDRPLTQPKDAAMRYLWNVRHWELDQVCASGGGCGAPRGAWGGSYWVQQRGANLHVTEFDGQPCQARFTVRALWHELFDAAPAPVQLSLF